MLRGFATVNYYADDLEAAKAWYTELLGVAPYYEVPGGYAEFRIGDFQHELGLISSAWAPPGATNGPSGEIMYWHVDDLAGSLDRLLALGAKEYQPITKHGEKGFTTASVIDPFGNILGIMYNPHYLEVVSSIREP
ncbi:VOC family protein [Nonomuraea sp. NN258]|uniref:VOC family protein n=1 Tax=Nonomuraea antri TaxID=2730852 RepID=UPI0015685674|nr:VOC family protein [Nonomuraea antri]NRQ33018.1 VOC family protein [Nonomuraea antri]